MKILLDSSGWIEFFTGVPLLTVTPPISVLDILWSHRRSSCTRCIRRSNGNEARKRPSCFPEGCTQPR